ncbi:MAG: hypothetical protein Q8K60_05290, partial [Parachlamydiaceae bacterium]|nr:hypothetical protein [Parachlamydiaceae bacterium]
CYQRDELSQNFLNKNFEEIDQYFKDKTGITIKINDYRVHKSKKTKQPNGEQYASSFFSKKPIFKAFLEENMSNSVSS